MFAGAFTAIQYATGAPITRQIAVPATPIRSVFRNVSKNVGVERFEVAVERQDVVRVRAEQPRLVAEAVPEHDGDRRDEEHDEPRPRGKREGERGEADPTHPPRPWPCSRCRPCAPAPR